MSQSASYSADLPQTFPMRPYITLLVYLTSLLPIFVVIAFMYQNMYPIPVRDQWASRANDFGTVTVATHARMGTLTFSDLLHQHTEHRHFTYRLVTALVAVTTNWDIQYESWVGFVLALLTLLMLVHLFARHQARLWPLGLVAFSALVFSLRQDNVWLGSNMTVWIYGVFFLVLATWCVFVLPISYATLGLCLITLTLMTFTIFTGFLAWPILAIALWLRGYRRWLVYVLMGIVLLVVAIVFFTDYTMPSQGLNLDVKDVVRWTFSNLGAPLWPYLSDDWGLSMRVSRYIAVVGMIGLAVNAMYVLWRERDSQCVGVWLALAAYGLGSALLVGLGRGSYAHRYVVASNLVWIALIALVLMAMWHIWHRPARYRWEAGLFLMNGAGLLIMAGLYIYTNVNTMPQEKFGQYSQDRDYWVNCLLNYPIDRNESCFGEIAPFGAQHPDDHYTRASGISIQRLTVFHDLPVPAAMAHDTSVIPVIIEAPTAWQAYHMWDRLPQHLRTDKIMFVLPIADDETHAILDDVGVCVGMDDQGWIATFIQAASELWVMQYERDTVTAHLADDYILEDEYPAYTDPTQPFSMIRYQRPG